MPSPKPFAIDVPQSKIDSLRQKLSLAEFPDELEGAAWDLGCPLADMRRLTEAWKHFDWRKAEKKLNEYPHFHTDIDVEGFGNLDIHFVHQRSEVEGAIPMLFSHGCKLLNPPNIVKKFLIVFQSRCRLVSCPLTAYAGPGSFIEVLKILPLLTRQDSSGPAFHVVAPSLPNYGFSQGVSKRGFGAAQYAETCHKLMLQLGYEEYVTQGGDWGFWITRTIGKLYPESCKASHLNMILARPPNYRENPLLALQHSIYPYSRKERNGVKRTEWFHKEGFGEFWETAPPYRLEYESRLQSPTIHQAPDCQLCSPRLTSCRAWLDIREAARLGRRISLDRR